MTLRLSHRPALPKALRHEANRWLMRRDCGLMSEADEAQWQDWLATDPRHRQAYAEAEALFGALDASVMPTQAVARPVITPKRLFKGAALAAGIALSLIGGAEISVRLQADYLTAHGEQKTLTLSDGSSVVLNSDTALRVDYKNGRHLRILRGEAAFQVAPDPARPFTVETAHGTTTALGTRFIVRRTEGNRAQVVVTEHSVKVAHAGQDTIVSEGFSLTYGPQGLTAPSAVKLSDADAWTRGHLRFVDRPLSQVVDELNRYHKGRIFLTDRRLKTLPVNGLFDIDDTEGALAGLERALGLKARHLGAGIVILEK